MNKKIVGILVSMLLFATFTSVAGTTNNEINDKENVLRDTENWPTFQHDPQHTGYTTSLVPET